MTSLTLEACKELGVKPRDAERSKNFFALGLISWMYTRPVDPTIEWIEHEVRLAAAWCATPTSPRSRPACTSARPPSCSSTLPDPAGQAASPGKYRNITGNLAVAYGLIAAAQQASLPILYASYPITPASDILHELSKHKNFGVRTLQAEDEIAAAAVRDRRRVRRSPRRHRHERPRRRPQVGGARARDQPRAAAGARRRAARWPVDRVCPPRPSSPTSCSRCTGVTVSRRCRSSPPSRRATASTAAFEAVRIALEVPHAGHPPHRRLRRQRRPSRGCSPTSTRCPTSRCRSRPSPTTTASSGPTCATPRRSPDRGRSPARPGLMHRIGGIEKQDGTGNVNYDPANHELMTHIRADKVVGHRQRHPAGRGRRRRRRRGARARMGEHVGPDQRGGAPGARRRAPGRRTRTSCTSTRSRRTSVRCSRAYPKVLVPEMNLGQLSRLVRAEFLVDATVAHARCRACRSAPPRSRTKIVEMIDA